jgi:hypothetical protein
VLGPVAGLFQRRSWGRTPRLCGFAAPRAGADVRGAHTGERAFPPHATGLRTGDYPSLHGITPPAGSSAMASLHSFQHARVRLHLGATTLAVAKHPRYYTRTNTRSHGAPHVPERMFSPRTPECEHLYPSAARFPRPLARCMLDFRLGQRASAARTVRASNITHAGQPPGHARDHGGSQYASHT